MAEQDPVLDTHISLTSPTAPSSEPPKSYTYYHAGPLFTLGELAANVRLSSYIKKISNNKYQPILPQDLEQRDTSPHSIRDDDIKALLSCDLALFTYDGVELDSGTVVEYMIAKFADIPTVILRSDFRGAGDQVESNGDPWNLMSSFWPRTVGVVVHSMTEYKIGLAKAIAEAKEARTSDQGEIASSYLVQSTAEKVVNAFNEVVQQPSRLPKELREPVYQWLALMPAFKAGTDGENVKEMLKLLQEKEQKGLHWKYFA